MRQNADQKNFKYGNFLHNYSFSIDRYVTGEIFTPSENVITLLNSFGDFLINGYRLIAGNQELPLIKISKKSNT